MSTYVVFFSYTKEAKHDMVEQPEDREQAAREVIEAAEGRLLAFYWMLGEHDGLAIYDVPSATAAAAISAATTASGRIADLETVHLLSSPEARAALELAKAIAGSYKPPGGLLENWRTDYDALG
jgi:uncharacterized protein with GYD domain